jgi:peroxiredoxin
MPQAPLTIEPRLAHPSRRRLLAYLPACAVALPGLLQAATPGSSELPELEGTASNGQRIRLDALRGQVVLVFYWSTGCAVCRDTMRELRANLAGWKDQPFTLLGVNMDANLQDFLTYEKLVAQTVPGSPHFVSVSALGPAFRDTMGRPGQLPGGCLIDKQGRLVERYAGRIPPATWDRIADLL